MNKKERKNQMIGDINIKNLETNQESYVMMPITELELKDVYEEIGTSDREKYAINYGMDCYWPSELLTGDGSLEELNCIVVMWERMDEIQRKVLENLVPPEWEPLTMKSLIHMACRAENSKTLLWIRNGQELGEYVLQQVQPELQNSLSEEQEDRKGMWD